MNLTLTYTNHRGESIEFGPDSIYHYGEHGLFDYTLSYSSENGIVSAIQRDPIELPFPVGIQTDDDAKGLDARDRLRRVLEIDVFAEKPGSITSGDYKLTCWIIGSAKQHWWHTDKLCEANLTVLAQDPAWIREAVYSFKPGAPVDMGGLDYEHDYEYDYTAMTSRHELNIDAIVPSDFRMVIYGPAENPRMVIGQNLYEVEVTMAAGEILVIDSRKEDEPILLTGVHGYTTDLFHKRIRGAKGSGQYIFEPIPAGYVPIFWDGSFGWDLHVFIAESEPKWAGAL